MSYEVLEHPADAKFRSQGETRAEAFKGAVEAFSDIVGGESGMYHHEIEVESENLDALLFDFLDELIFLQDTENVVISHASELGIKELEDGWRLEAKIMVDDITSEVEVMDVKGPTYSEMQVEYEKDTGWIVQAVIDI